MYSVKFRKLSNARYKADLYVIVFTNKEDNSSISLQNVVLKVNKKSLCFYNYNILQRMLTDKLYYCSLYDKSALYHFLLCLSKTLT